MASTLSRPHPAFPRKHPAARPTRHTGESRKPRRPPTSGQWLVDSGQPQPPGTWAPAFAPPSFRRKPETTRPQTLRDVDPRFRPPPPSFRRKPETTPPPNPQGRGPRLSPGRRVGGAWETGLGRPPGFRPPSFRRKPETTPPPNPQGRGPRPPTPRHSGESRKPRRPPTLRDVDPGPQPPVIPAKAGNHAAPQPPGTWTPAFAGETGGGRLGDGVGSPTRLSPPRHSGFRRNPRAPLPVDSG